MNILLIGMMGSGKTTIGKNLAKTLSANFLETDPIVLSKTGFSTPHEVFETNICLWKESEIAVMKRLSLGDKQVIACGGALVENKINLDFFRTQPTRTLVVYLSADPETLAKRLVQNHEKTSLQDLPAIQSNIQKLYDARDPLYRQYADLVIDNSKLSAIDSTDLILKKIRE